MWFQRGKSQWPNMDMLFLGYVKKYILCFSKNIRTISHIFQSKMLGFVSHKFLIHTKIALKARLLDHCTGVFGVLL